LTTDNLLCLKIATSCPLLFSPTTLLILVTKAACKLRFCVVLMLCLLVHIFDLLNAYGIGSAFCVVVLCLYTGRFY